MTSCVSMSSLLLAVAPGRDRGFWMPEQASTVAANIDRIFMFITWVSIVFFVLIVALMVYFMIRYRRPSNDHRPMTNAATHNTPLELTWTIVPLVLVIVIFYIGMQGYIELRTAPADAYRVVVTAQKWNWTFEHPNGATETGTLHVPANRPVILQMYSEDVIHSLYIPAFRVKQDVVPGRTATLWFEATRPGDYDLFCAEYCGTQHATMSALVTVVPEHDFPRVIEELARWIDEYTDERLFEAGPRLYARCVACHTLDATDRVGPSFRETYEYYRDGRERELADGSRVLVDGDYLRTSILNPRRYTVAGFPDSMPSFQGQLRERELIALIEFIKNLDRFDEQGNLIEQGR